jgi:mannosyltransferase OCH1-like enzyme
MGKGSAAWQMYLATPEDRNRLAFFQALYERNSAPAKRETIPRVLHFIWLGPKPLPKASFLRMAHWEKQHPGWLVKLWTDQVYTEHDSKIETHLFTDFPFERYATLYYDSDNVKERSEILRYALLEEEGGIYVDHDMECVQSLEELRPYYDFFCGLESLQNTLLSSSVYPTTNLIASMPHHPILQYSLEWLQKNWDRLEEQYPGSDLQSMIYRVKRRSFSALSMGVAFAKEHAIVFPATYFNKASTKEAKFATHLHAGDWHKKNLDTKKWQKRFKKLSDRSQWGMSIAYLGCALNGLLLIFLCRRIRKT